MAGLLLKYEYFCCQRLSCFFLSILSLSLKSIKYKNYVQIVHD